MTDLGRYLLVELEPGVHPRRVAAFMDVWAEYRGVVRIVDLAAIGEDTLSALLRKPEPVHPKRKSKRAKAP